MRYLYMNGELYHYGIKGQKWGVRNGPPYPLDDEDYTSTEKRFKIRKNVIKKKISKNNTEVNKSNRSTSLTDTQKKILVYGAIAVGTGIALYGGYKIGKMIKSSSFIDSVTGLPKIKTKESYRDALSKINLGRIQYHSKEKNLEIIEGSSANCMLCTTAYDMRRRGFDVHAGFSTNGFLPDDLFPRIYKNYTGTTKISLNPKVWRYSSADSRVNELVKKINSLLDTEGPARGNLIMWWNGNNGGHSIIWERDETGSLRFLDGQINKHYSFDDLNKLLLNSNKKPLEFLRTDNLDVNYSEMNRLLNTDNAFKTYIKHGKDVVSSLSSNTLEGAIVASGAPLGLMIPVALNKKKQQQELINAYKNEHPKTQKSDQEILELSMKEGSTQ